MSEAISAPRAPHSVTLENCQTLTATGIRAILSYDSASAVLDTPAGTLTVGGEALCVSELSVQAGEVRISGEIAYLQYAAPKKERGGFWGRLVR